ncbi:hypothetical protein B2G52_04215 [Neisseria lactamica]|uniref:Uncharacterized protein n=1 Tax=Neisseria lactamica TaxID=486 RepID=A0AAU8VF75_NEILA|nr:hypothetical protein B2G52_04215 [Neisseria lactamica]
MRIRRRAGWRHMGFQTAFLRNRRCGYIAGFAVILGTAAAGATITGSFCKGTSWKPPSISKTTNTSPCATS